MKIAKLLLAFVVLLTASFTFAQTGKITGQVVDAESGEALPGVNVIVEETQLGAATDADGYYTILNVPPGNYSVTASFIGYAQTTVQDVNVNIDLTTTVNFELTTQAIAGEEVIVQAEQEVIRADVSASRVDVTSAEMESLPVTDVEEVISLQAGVQGLSVRGSNNDEVGYMVDGLSLNSGRTQNPYQGISYTAVQEVQVQAGGFNAEYGNMRSGVVNLVTKEGSRDRYSGEVMVRYSPAAKKNFGALPTDPESYWMKPYLDPATAFEGTDVEAWDDYTRRQYPEFDGFNEIADQEPTLTPQAAQELFMWRHRRDLEIDKPDYTGDASLSGPVPFLSESLGNLRFLASYRQMQEQYIIPLSRDGYWENNAMLKLTSDITSNMKLMVQGMYGTQEGTNTSGGRFASPYTSIARHGDREQVRGFDGNFSYGLGSDAIFGDGVYPLGEIDHRMIGLKLTHNLSSNTFYEFRAQNYLTDYLSGPPRARDTTTVQVFGSGFEADEAPLGFSFLPHNSLTGLRMGAHHSEFRDTSYTSRTKFSFDISSQVNRTNLLKAGVEFNITNHNVDYEHKDFLKNPDDVVDSFEQSPLYLAAYVQDKLEFGGMIANVGLRLDYHNPRVSWYQFENPFVDALMGKNADAMESRDPEVLEPLGVAGFEEIDPTLSLSPRLGISFPVTVSSKLYFNYGHFHQNPVAEQLYMTQRDIIANAIRIMSNPNVPSQQTTAYEMGYEQSILNQFRIRVAGYYKALSDQPRWEEYFSQSGLVNYWTNQPHNYEDIRGFEISVHKTTGRWVRGFINYNYMATKSGDFGFPNHYENVVEQRQFERFYRAYQNKPLPRPYGRFSLEFLVPEQFGPQVSGLYPLGGWSANLLGRWQAGQYFTWTGETSVPGVTNNMQWVDYRMVDLRLSKRVNLSQQGPGSRVTLFVDINNVFNIKNFNTASFYGPRDFQNYMESLKLPEDIAKDIPDYNQEKGFGDDRPGDLDKDYIDPPNGNSFRYIFPRDVHFGVRLSF